MPRIKRTTYRKAVELILKNSGFRTKEVEPGYIFGEQDGLRICVCINGKHLPYFNKAGMEIFEWETYVNPTRLDEAIRISQEHRAESWVTFAYYIQSKKFEQYFTQKTTINGLLFGTRMIKTSDYQDHMQKRSPNSWDRVELPRKQVESLTIEPNQIFSATNMKTTSRESKSPSSNQDLFPITPSLNPIITKKPKPASYEPVSLTELVSRIADILVSIDKSREPFKKYQAGVGPYGEPQLVKKISQILNTHDDLIGIVVTKRSPDLLIRGKWALEFKIVRPYGDNNFEAENWSVNLLHPYEGNTSLIGDCLKLLNSNSSERKAVIVIGYKHDPPKILLSTLIESFEVLADQIMGIKLGKRIKENRVDLIHPVHQQLTVFAWEVFA